MNKHYTSIALTALLGLSMTACASAPEASKPTAAAAPVAAAPAEPAKPSLSEEAKAALAQAEADAKAAKAAYTFWIPAANALKKAQEAAKTLDNATVIKQSKAVSDLCKVSALQPGYASTELK